MPWGVGLGDEERDARGTLPEPWLLLRRAGDEESRHVFRKQLGKCFRGSGKGKPPTPSGPVGGVPLLDALLVYDRESRAPEGNVVG